jgi:RND family efflux transporter MFP subunit
MTNRKRLLSIAGIIIGAIVIARVMIFLRPDPPRRPPEPETPIVTVESAIAGSGPIIVFGSGTVRPRSEIDLSPQVSGRIVAVSPNLQSGGQVSLGEVLVQIDPSDYENRVQQAQADVALQRVAVLQAEEEATIAASEYEQFRTRERGRGNTTQPPGALTLREPQLRAARAGLTRAEAQLHDAELALARTEIVAPFDGRVRQETADVGRVASPGQSLGRIYASDALEVVIPISDDDAVLIPSLWTLQAGDDDRSIPATVVTDYGTRRFAWNGYVDRAETALDEQSRTIDVVVRVPDPFQAGRLLSGDPANATSPPLLVGQFAEIRIEGLDLEEFFVVPRRALRPDNEVWAIGQDGTVRIVSVEVLQEANGRVYVAGDFVDGQAVIVGGVSIATNGMVVRINAGPGR